MELEGIRYVVLADSGEIEKFVISTCEEEWDPEDFDTFGDDLYGNAVLVTFLRITVFLFGTLLALWFLYMNSRDRNNDTQEMNQEP